MLDRIMEWVYKCLHKDQKPIQEESNMIRRSTQLAAYESIKSTLPQSRSTVLKCLVVNDAMAGFEIADVLKRPLHTISGRLTELAKLGLIADSGDRVLNPATNRAAIMWRTTIGGSKIV